MRNFRDIREKTMYDEGHAEGFGKGLLFGCVWAVLVGILIAIMSR